VRLGGRPPKRRSHASARDNYPAPMLSCCVARARAREGGVTPTAPPVAGGARGPFPFPQISSHWLLPANELCALPPGSCCLLPLLPADRGPHKRRRCQAQQRRNHRRSHLSQRHRAAAIESIQLRRSAITTKCLFLSALTARNVQATTSLCSLSLYILTRCNYKQWKRPCSFRFNTFVRLHDGMYMYQSPS
jgi:hypothetical protein